MATPQRWGYTHKLFFNNVKLYAFISLTAAKKKTEKYSPLLGRVVLNWLKCSEGQSPGDGCHKAKAHII